MIVFKTMSTRKADLMRQVQSMPTYFMQHVQPKYIKSTHINIYTFNALGLWEEASLTGPGKDVRGWDRGAPKKISRYHIKYIILNFLWCSEY